MNDSAFTLYIAPPKKRHGRFKKGDTPWNKGMSWEEQGVSNEERKRRIAILQANSHKNGYSHKPTYSKPVIQMGKYGDWLHWYESSESAARKLGITGRNIRKVCDGERHTCGGYYWKWDERFL